MGRLARQSVLVVEDEVLIAMELEDLLTEAGCGTVRLATSVPEALQAVADQRPDVAVLDVSVRGEAVFPVADALAEAAIPYVLLTGHSQSSMPERQRGQPLILKPYDPKNLLDVLAGVIAANHTACAPKPREGA